MANHLGADGFHAGGCGEKFYDLSEAAIREVPLSEAYGWGLERGRFLEVSYQGGEFPVYRVPLLEYLHDHRQIEEVRLLIEGEPLN